MQKAATPGLVESIRRGVIEGRAEETAELTRQAIAEGVSVLELYQEALIPAMEKVGALMQSGEYFIPEVLMSAKAMQAASEVLKPALLQSKDEVYRGKVVIGTVEGDLHDIGKNLVKAMLEGAGFQVTDLGIDVSADRFLAAVKESKPDILALSALLSITMVRMNDVIAALREAGCRQSVKVIVGGAVVSQTFADDIGADGYARDAGGAAQLAKNLTEVK